MCKDFTKLKMKYAYNVLYVSFRDTIPYPNEYFLMLQENQWTAVRRAVEWKTCKRQTDDRNWHQFGAGLGGSNAFVWSMVLGDAAGAQFPEFTKDTCA